MYQWLKKHCFLQPSTKKRPRGVLEWTHTLYSGGVFYTDDETYNEFLKRFAIEIDGNKDEVLPINENGTEIFKFYQDLDYELDYELSEEELISHILHIQECIKAFYEDLIKELSSDEIKLLFSAYVLKSPIKKTKENKYKNGIHIIWPFIRVNKEMALYMHYHTVGSLFQKFGTIMDHKSFNQGGWENILDDMVYKRNALRMPFTHKTISCCFDISCIKCSGKNRIIEKRPYHLKMVLNGNGEKEIKELSTLSILQLCSIRLTKVNQILTPKWKNISSLKDINFSRSEKLKTLKHLDKNWEYIIEAINSLPVYKEVFIENNIKEKVFSNGNKCFFINVGGNGSRYCHNVMREHSSAKIYFMLTSYGLYQKCYCSCKTIHERSYNIPCSKFKYTIPINKNIIKRIYQNDELSWEKAFNFIDDEILLSLDDSLGSSQDTISYDSYKMRKIDELNSIKIENIS